MIAKPAKRAIIAPTIKISIRVKPLLVILFIFLNIVFYLPQRYDSLSCICLSVDYVNHIICYRFKYLK